MKSVLFLILAIVLFTAGDASAAYSKDYQPSDESLVSTTVVINEVYGGAGCGTPGCSTFQNDFIELRNISAGLVNIGGWSVQYASATGTAWQVTPIPAGTVLRPGDTFLIAEAFGANGVNPLPPPNVTGTIAMSATAGKIALVNNSVALSGTCPVSANIIDLVGYGATASCFETAVASAPSTTASISRNGAGADNDSNSTDFSLTNPPTPTAALQPTAANASIKGRVATSNGRGISKVTVTLVDGSGNTQTALTSSFGYFSFEELNTGTTYTISVSSKQYQFNPATRVISLDENAENFDFTAEP